MDIRTARYSDPDVVRLVDEVQQEYVVRYGGPDETYVDPAMFEPPQGLFLVGYDDEPVAMGGWKWRPDVAALGGSSAVEVKRMYVVQAARQRGNARAMLTHLEESARRAGADLVVLETGLRQPEAIALYESAGYLPVAGFGFYKDAPLSRCFGKRL